MSNSTADFSLIAHRHRFITNPVSKKGACVPLQIFFLTLPLKMFLRLILTLPSLKWPFHVHATILFFVLLQSKILKLSVKRYYLYTMRILIIMLISINVITLLSYILVFERYSFQFNAPINV